MGGDSIAVDKDGSLFLSSQVPRHADCLLAAFLKSAGNRSSRHGEKLVSYGIHRHSMACPRYGGVLQIKSTSLSSTFMAHPLKDQAFSGPAATFREPRRAADGGNDVLTPLVKTV